MRNSKRGRNTGRVYRGVRDAADVDFDPDRTITSYGDMSPFSWLKTRTRLVFNEVGDIPLDIYDKLKAAYPSVSAEWSKAANILVNQTLEQSKKGIEDA